MELVILFFTFASFSFAQNYSPPRSAARPAIVAPPRPAARPTGGPALFYRMGGKKVVTNLVADFYDRLKDDMRIQGFFSRTDKSHFKESLFTLVCQLGRGPCRYKGKNMKSAHEGMGVSANDYTAFIDDLTRSMTKVRIRLPEQKELIALFASMRKDVVEAP